MAITPLNLNSFLKSYLESNKTLAKTIVIKLQASNDVLNDYIKLRYGEQSVDPNDPTSWKYYRNLAGLYHPLDTPMTVTSLDNLEEIVFSKENLVVHSATAEAYQYGSRYYYSLLSRYPNQEQLILGILYPVDIEKAISAEEGTILGYPSYLVEPQEMTLIAELESYVKHYLVRWNVQSFGLSDSLYNTAYHAVLYLNLLPKLLNLRLKRCKTNEAHSFHIRQYLASNGRLDRYLPYMTLKQALFLYRNINYLERNAGKVEQFKLLIEKLLSDRRIPLSEYSVRHLDGFDSEYYTDIITRKKPINVQYNIPEKDYITIEELYLKEYPLAYGNYQYYESNRTRDTRMFQNSTSSVVQTKDLESSMIDYNDAVPDPFEAVLLRQWVYMANNDMYNVVVNFQDPKTSETRSLYALDAFIYFYYVSLKSIGIPVFTIPNFINLKYRRHPKPSLSDLLSVVDNSFSDIPEIAKSILNEQPAIVACQSTDAFFDLSHKIYEQSHRHWLITSNIGDHYKRALVANMILRLYADKETVINSPIREIGTWLEVNNLPEYDFNNLQAQELLINIFTQATGLVIDTARLLKNIQKAMLQLFTELSSYSIQFMRDINDSTIRPLNWAAIRLGNPKFSLDEYRYIDQEVLVVNHKGKIKQGLSIDTEITNLVYKVGQSFDSKINYPVELSTIYKAKEDRHFDVHFTTIRLTADYDGYDPEVSNYTPFIGYESFLALSENQRSQIKSIYS